MVDYMNTVSTGGSNAIYFTPAQVLLIVAIANILLIAVLALHTKVKVQKVNCSNEIDIETGNETKQDDSKEIEVECESHTLEKKPSRRANVVLVGAGPGDAELLTVGAYRVLQEADLVIADVLVSKEILSLCKGKVKLSNKCKGSAHSAQDELNQWMVDGARQGLYVCRLKGGDPFLFGRATEEIQYVLDHGFSVKVIPGISSSMSSSLASGIPITSRGLVNQVCVATGHGRDDSFPNLPEYREKRSYALLMGISRLASLSQSLMKKGYPVDFPVAIVEKATTPDQRVIQSTLDDIAEEAKHQKVESPATIIMGPVVGKIKWNRDAQIEYMAGGVYYYPSFK